MSDQAQIASTLSVYQDILCNIQQEKAPVHSAKGKPRLRRPEFFSFRVRCCTITQETADNSSRESGAYWLKHAQGISARLIKIVTRTPCRFLDNLCYSFPKSKTDSLFTNPRNELARLSTVAKGLFSMRMGVARNSESWRRSTRLSN